MIFAQSKKHVLKYIQPMRKRHDLNLDFDWPTKTLLQVVSCILWKECIKLYKGKRLLISLLIIFCRWKNSLLIIIANLIYNKISRLVKWRKRVKLFFYCLSTQFFLYKNPFYKNHEAQKSPLKQWVYCSRQ